jgi:tetratricopeptide (TPR) repeat protein
MFGVTTYVETPSAAEAEDQTSYSSAVDDCLYRAAEEACNRAILLTKDPSDLATLYVKRADIYDTLKRYSEAIKDCDWAIGLKQDFAQAYFTRAGEYFALQKWSEAKVDLDRAIALEPDYALAWRRRAAVESRLGNAIKSRADYVKAIQLHPTGDAAYAQLGSSYPTGPGRGENAFAMKYLNLAIRLNPNNAYAYRQRGRVRMSFLPDEIGLADLTRAIELLPDSPMTADTYVSRGAYLITNGQRERAKTDLETALRLEPGNAMALKYLQRYFGDVK